MGKQVPVEQPGKRRRPAPGALAAAKVTAAKECRAEAATKDLLIMENARGRKRKQPEGTLERECAAEHKSVNLPGRKQEKVQLTRKERNAEGIGNGKRVPDRTSKQKASCGNSAAPAKKSRRNTARSKSPLADEEEICHGIPGDAADEEEAQLVKIATGSTAGTKPAPKRQGKAPTRKGASNNPPERSAEHAAHGNGGSSVGKRSRPAVARDVLKFEAEEEIQETVPTRRAGRTLQASSPARQPKQQLPPAAITKTLCQKPGQRERSPTPVAAAAVLEVSQTPSPAREASAEIDDAQLDQNPCYAANTWLMTRLRDPRSKEARGGTLRPQLQAVHGQLISNLENTIELGHNNSMLVLGPRGSGKTLVVERALGDVCAKYNTSAKNPLVAVVRLLGYAHADERVAFREIARQLVEQFDGNFLKSASEADNIKFLTDILKQLQRSHKVAVFVLDDFDLFARRSKQMVLYNLLDALVTSGMQAAMLGLTPRQDVIEMLEKRVKSRFSHRKLNVTLPISLQPWQRGEGASSQQEDGMLDVLKSMLLLPASFSHQQHALRFNRAVEAAVASAEVATALERALPSCPTLDHMSLVVESALRASYEGNGLVTSRQLVEALGELQQRTRDMVLAVSQLSVLELILLVAMQRLANKHKGEAMNFEMVHYEFRQYASQGGHADNYSKGAAAKAFDHLITQGLVVYVDSRNETRAGARQYAAVYLQVQSDEVEAGMKEHCNCPQPLMLWLTRQAGAGNTAATMML